MQYIILQNTKKGGKCISVNDS